MSKRLVIIYEAAGRPAYHDGRLDLVRERFPQFEFEIFTDRAEYGARMNEDVEIVAGEISPAELARTTNLKWLHTWSGGPDWVLFPEMRAREEILLSCSRGNGAIPLAEHGMMMMLMLNRDAMRWVRAQQEHRWDRFTHGELTDLTCGIIGLGISGKDLAQKAKAFHMEVIGLRRQATETPFVDEVFTYDQLHEFLARSDFVIVTAAMSDETKDLIGEAELRAMKSSAYLIVYSRGGIVDDNALLRALNEGWIAGAGIDAHGVEPLPADSPFWDAPNVILTPHNGAVSLKAGIRCAEIFEANLERYLAGEPLIEPVDRNEGFKPAAHKLVAM